VCVECLFLCSPESLSFRGQSACAKRAAYPDPHPYVVPHPESLAAQAAYTEDLLWISWKNVFLDTLPTFIFLLPGSGLGPICFQALPPPRALGLLQSLQDPVL